MSNDEIKIDISVRQTDDYANAINDIGELLADKYEFNDIEAYGILEAVKLEIMESMTDE